MKYTLLSFLLLLSWKCLAQIQVGVKDSVYSNLLNEQRDLLIYLPQEVRENKDTTMLYPVLYVLDGNTHFLSVSGMVDQLSDKGGNTVLPKMIVVCVLNTNRTRDLTPYKVAAGGFLSEDMANETGGGAKFAQFMEKELFPYLTSRYPVSGYRALVGHSLGGIFALQVLAQQPELFDDYLVIDPSTWYDQRKFANGVLDSLASGNYEGKSLFVAMANTNNEPDTTRLKLIQTDFSEHQKSILEFTLRARKLSTSGLTFIDRYYPNDDHNSVPMIATYDGLRELFKSHRFSFDGLHAPDFSPLRSIPDHFARLSKKIKHPMRPSPEFLELCDLYYTVIPDSTRKEETRTLYLQLYPEKAKDFYKVGLGGGAPGGS
jgi:predicted alpha/beta superfamily hydrolase